MLVRTAKRLQQGRYEWDFGHGFSSYKNEVNEIAQDIETALYEFKYNCFFDLESGIDWVTRLGKKGQKDLLDTDIQNIIINRYGVLGIDNFESILLGRTYSCSCTVYHIFSEQPFILDFSQGV